MSPIYCQDLNWLQSWDLLATPEKDAWPLLLRWLPSGIAWVLKLRHGLRLWLWQKWKKASRYSSTHLTAVNQCRGKRKAEGHSKWHHLCHHSTSEGDYKDFPGGVLWKLCSQPHGMQDGSKSPAIQPAEMRNPSLECHSLRNTWLPQFVRASLGREVGWYQLFGWFHGSCADQNKHVSL